MKKSFLILSLTALGCSLSVACGDDGQNDNHNDGGAAGDGDGEGGAAGDGDGDGEGGAAHADVCSDLVTEIGQGEGGAGGAAALTCETPDAPKEKIAIAGKYIDSYDGPHTITDEVWDTGWSKFYLSLVNNEERYALALNADQNGYFPCMWSRFVWTEQGGELYYCQAPYGAESECAAEENKMPDTDDLDAGCNGFSWSSLSKSK